MGWDRSVVVAALHGVYDRVGVREIGLVCAIGWVCGCGAVFEWGGGVGV